MNAFSDQYTNVIHIDKDFINSNSLNLIKLATRDKEISVKINPENLEVANAYLSTGSAITAASQMGVNPDQIYAVLQKSEDKELINIQETG